MIISIVIGKFVKQGNEFKIFKMCNLIEGLPCMEFIFIF